MRLHTTTLLLVCAALVALSHAQDNATTTTAATTTSSATTAAPIRVEPANVTTPTTTTTVAPDEEEDEEPRTSTVDSVGVDTDELATTTVTSINNTEEANTTPPPESERSLAGSNDAPSNSLTEPSGKLSIAPEEDNSSSSGEDAASTNTTPKPAPVAHLNMSLIDEVFTQARKDERGTVESWQRLGKNLKRGITGVIGSLVPYALNMSAEAKIGSECSGAMLKWVLSMNQLKSWALRMLDASGKPIAGLLEGSLTMFGNYRQCLKIRAPDDDEIEFAGEFREYFRGKYCIVQVKPWLPEKSRFYNLNTKLDALVKPSASSADANNNSEESNEDEEHEPAPWYERTVFDELSEWALAFNFVNIRMDVCVPSLCSREDIQKAIAFMLRGIDLKARVLRCEMDSPDGSYGSAVESSTSHISPRPPTATKASASKAETRASLVAKLSQLGWLLVPIVCVCIVLIATALSMTPLTGKRSGSLVRKPGKLAHTIHSLSLKRSVSSHLNVDYEQLADDKPLALYGLRFVIVMWIVVVESAVNLKFEYLRELLMLKDLIFWWPMQFIINSSLQFDSIILLTAFTMAYKNCINDTLLNQNTKSAITRFVLDKYMRLMPSIMVMVALVVMLPLLYSGPVWNDYVVRQSNVCHTSGWLNMLFLQNYLPYKDICLPQTWLVCIEFQLVLLMSPIVYYLNKIYNSNEMSLSSVLTAATTKTNSHNSTRSLYWLRTLPGNLLVGCIVMGLASSFYNVYANDLPPSWFYTMADPDSKALYFGEHMMRLWTHVAVFAIGIIAGLECRRAARNISRAPSSATGNASATSAASLHHSPSLFAFGNKNNNNKYDIAASLQDKSSSMPTIIGSGGGSSTVSINFSNNDSNEAIHKTMRNNGSAASDVDSLARNKSSLGRIVLDIVCGLVVAATMAAIIFTPHDWSLNNLPKPLVAGAFDAGSRLVWSLAMVWILYMLSVPNSHTKQFSCIARALGHPFMVSLGKLSFLVYIIHPFVHTTVLAIQEQPIYSSWLMLFHIMIGNISITVILASLMSLFVEMPCRNLFKRCTCRMWSCQISNP